MCKVNGVQFICEQRDNRRRTQNSGVMAHGGRNRVDYYGVLYSVVELVYGQDMTVHLFKCRWFDTRLQSMKTDQYGILSVRIRDEELRLVDVDPNQETDEDSGDEEIHILPEIISDTEEDSSDDSDYEP
ncbi:hypothetical protein ACLB2K_031977 [Fragaria x ananassa]